AAPSADREENRNAPAATPAAYQRHDDEEQNRPDEGRQPAAAASAAPRRLPRRDRRLERRIDLKVKLVRKTLRDAQRHQLDAVAVVLPHEEGQGFGAKLARGRIGDEAFGAVPDLGANVPAPILARLLRHDEDDDTGVARRVSGLALLADLPLPADRQTHVLDR